MLLFLLSAVNKMIKEHGDLFSDSQCKVCSAVLISESQKLTHYQVSESTVSTSGDDSAAAALSDQSGAA